MIQRIAFHFDVAKPATPEAEARLATAIVEAREAAAGIFRAYVDEYVASAWTISTVSEKEGAS